MACVHSATMVLTVTARRSMPRKKRKRQVSTLESLMEWFQGTTDHASVGDRMEDQTEDAMNVTPAKSTVNNYFDLKKHIYPVQSLLGLSEGQLVSMAAAAAAALKTKDTTRGKQQEDGMTRTLPSPIHTNLSTSKLLPYKKRAVPAKRSLIFESHTQLKKLAVRCVPTMKLEQSEVAAVSHALQDELDNYLKKHLELTKSERRSLIQWAKTITTKLQICNKELLQTIQCQDEAKLQLEIKTIREETERLKRACMDAEIHAKASGVLYQIDALR